MRYTYKEIWIVVYPILLSLLMQELIGLTDTAYLGRVGDGETELGASALAGVYYLVIFMIGVGFSIGAQILIARRNGEGNYAQTGTIFYQGLIFLLVLATIMFFASKYFSSGFLRMLIKSDAIYTSAMSYLDWRIYGFFFSFTGAIFRSFYIGTTRTKILTLNALVMVTTNAALNYVLIFGKLGFPALGIAGAAIASVIAEIVSVIFFVLYTRYGIDIEKYGLTRFVGFKLKLLLRVLNISTWTMLQSFIAVGTWFIFFIAVEHLGERSLAITNIVRSISALFFILVHAFAIGAESLVSNVIGEGKPEQVLPLGRRIVWMAYWFILPLMAFVLIFPEVTLRVFSDKPELLADSAPSLRVMAGSYLIGTPCFILFNTVSGTGNTRAAFLMDIVALIVYMSFVVYVVVYLRADVAVCWISEYVYSSAMLVLSLLYLHKANWAHKKL